MPAEERLGGTPTSGHPEGHWTEAQLPQTHGTAQNNSSPLCFIDGLGGVEGKISETRSYLSILEWYRDS